MLDNMRFLVETLNKQEEAIDLLYNAAASGLYRDETYAIWEAVKSQEATLAAYCQQERERLAAILLADGEVKHTYSLPMFDENWTKRIEYRGEMFRVQKEDGAIKQIKYLEA